MPLIRVRMIARENLMVVPLMDASNRQLGQVSKIPGRISRWVSFSHPIPTVQAVTRVTDLVRRTAHFQGTRPS